MPEPRQLRPTSSTMARVMRDMGRTVVLRSTTDTSVRAAAATIRLRIPQARSCLLAAGASSKLRARESHDPSAL